MKLAIAGKGGAGKTTFTAITSRLIARVGINVVAIDADSNPNLDAALGIPDAHYSSLPISLVSRKLDGPRLNESVHHVLEQHSVLAPDGVLLLRMGRPEHADEGCLCSAHATVSAVVADLADQPNMCTILDLEASPEHLSRGTARHADVLVLIAEPYFRSLEAVRLQARLAAESSIGRIVVVANKIRQEGDLLAVKEFCERNGFELIGHIPWDTNALDADAQRKSLLDFAPNSPAVKAVELSVQDLLAIFTRTKGSH